MGELQWIWAASGKHPSAKDFFSIGAQFQLASDFSEWIKRGYPPLAERCKQGGACYSWRFWSRGARKDELVCGLLRDSHDSFGRPYPLLVIGNGTAPSWESRWEILPAMLEGVWCQLEQASMRPFSTVALFAEQIARTRAPEITSPVGCLAPEAMDGACREPAGPQPLDDLTRKVSLDEMGSIPLDLGGSGDVHQIIMKVCSILKGSLETAPNSLFVGGTNRESYLVFFRRPMKVADMMTLWGFNSGKMRDN